MEKAELVERRAIKRELLMKMSEEIKIIEEEPHNLDDGVKCPVKVTAETAPTENKKKKNKASPKKNTDESPAVKVDSARPAHKVEEVKKTIEVKETIKTVEEDSWNVVQAKKKV